MTVQEGYSYTLAAWLHSAEAWAQTGVVLAWYDDNGELLGEESTITPIEAGAWVEHTATSTAPAGATEAHLWIGMHGTPPASTVLHIDDIRWQGHGGSLRVGAGLLLAVTPL